MGAVNQEERHATAEHYDLERAELDALQSGRQIRIAGVHVGNDRRGSEQGVLAGASIRSQTRQALTNCEAILQADGAGLDDVLEVGILLSNPHDFAGMNDEYVRWFPIDPPTRYAAKLGAELPGLLVSIRMTAFITDPAPTIELGADLAAGPQRT